VSTHLQLTKYINININIDIYHRPSQYYVYKYGYSGFSTSLTPTEKKNVNWAPTLLRICGANCPD
jgi:hypothetical protein